jgi:hypothetical protein
MTVVVEDWEEDQFEVWETESWWKEGIAGEAVSR